MFLIKVELNRTEAKELLSDCQKMHQFVTSLFGTSRRESQILYRTNIVRNMVYIYIYSRNPAISAGNYKIQQRDISDWLERLKEGQMLSFDLIASPCKKVYQEERNKNSQRQILRNPAERLAWLEQKAEQSGFRILEVVEQGQTNVNGKHKDDDGGKMYHAGYHYQGALCITDDIAFRKALQAGIGPGKAYGFGLMMVQHL